MLDPIWRNKKNGCFYVIITIAKHSETQEEMVVYQRSDISNGQVWVRPKALFFEKFERVE